MPARHVGFFLGAGASKHFGYPLTNEIVQRVVRKLTNDTLFGERGAEARQRLRQDLRLVFPGIRLSDGDPALPNITEVLSLLDEWLRSTAMPYPGCTLDGLRELRHLLERAVCEVLVPEPAAAEKEAARRDADLLTLVQFMRDLATSEEARCTIVSTNYDLSIEDALFRAIDWQFIPEQVDFGVPWRDPGSGDVHQARADSPYAVLKLHGSLNWLRCALCDHIYVNPYGAIAELSEIETNADNTCHCGHHRLERVIVAPSFVRDVRNSAILSVWRAALERLRDATHWVIAGYSLPPEDVAIRSLLIRAYRGRGEPPHVRVVQRSTRAEPQYKLLFPDCVYDGDGMGALIKGLRHGAIP
jgi:hypothetical protein